MLDFHLLSLVYREFCRVCLVYSISEGLAHLLDAITGNAVRTQRPSPPRLIVYLIQVQCFSGFKTLKLRPSPPPPCLHQHPPLSDAPTVLFRGPGLFPPLLIFPKAGLQNLEIYIYFFFSCFLYLSYLFTMTCWALCSLLSLFLIVSN